MTPHPAPRRYTDRDIIARGAARLVAEDNPVLVEVAKWLTDVLNNYEDIGGIETHFARSVATAALTGQPDGAR